MKLKYGVLADYSATDVSGKHTIVGIFDLVLDVLNVKPIPLPPCYLAAAFQGHAYEGSDQTVQLRLRYDSGGRTDVITGIELPIKFAPGGPGQPIRAVMNVQIPNMAVPERGDYAIEIIVAGKPVGRVSFRVLAPPTAPA